MSDGRAGRRHHARCAAAPRESIDATAAFVGVKARSARIARPWRWVAHGGAGRTGGPARQRRPGPHDERDVMCATPCAPVRTRLSAQLRSGTIVAMETDDARVMAERLHMGDREDDGMPVIRHVRRVASRTPCVR